MPSTPRASFAIVAVLAACSSFDGADVDLAYLQTTNTGTVALGPSGGGADLGSRRDDFGADLGVDGPSPAPLLGATVQTGFGRFGASAFWIGESGDGTLSRPFGDLPAGTAVRSELDFAAVKTFWVYDLVRGATFRFAPGVALDFLDANVRAESIGSGGFEELEVFAPVPMLFGDAELALGPVSIGAQVGGSNVHLRDGRGTYWDLEGRVGFVPAERLELFAGYRYVSMDADGIAGSRDAAVDLQVHGWFLGGEYHF